MGGLPEEWYYRVNTWAGYSTVRRAVAHGLVGCIKDERVSVEESFTCRGREHDAKFRLANIYGHGVIEEFFCCCAHCSAGAMIASIHY